MLIFILLFLELLRPQRRIICQRTGTNLIFQKQNWPKLLALPFTALKYIDFANTLKTKEKKNIINRLEEKKIHKKRREHMKQTMIWLKSRRVISLTNQLEIINFAGKLYYEKYVFFIFFLKTICCANVARCRG